jgi:4-diphosphocytidyl-2-C-methyl-D-erythritol kinase
MDNQSALVRWGEPLPAPAKLNLDLRVLGRRDDGYHLLDTLFCLIDRFDTLRFEARDDGQICRAGGPAAIAPNDDLCVRAARLLQEHAAMPRGCTITLQKSIPVGGGLGGGSSDAAATLLALNQLWQLKLDRGALQGLALRLGADVPFFIFGQTARGRGIGEILEPAQPPSPGTAFLVLVPPVAVPTKEVFRALALTRQGAGQKIPPFFRGERHNDLEPIVCRMYPRVREHLDWLSQFGVAQLSGSGACVFAAFPDLGQARSVHAQLPEGIQGFVAQPLVRHPLYECAA